MHPRALLFTFCFVLFALIACSPVSDPPTVPPPQPTTRVDAASATPTQPTAKATALPPTATATATQTPTRVPPTATRTFTRAPIATVIVTATPSVTPTPSKYPLPPGKGGFVLQNYVGKELNFTMNDKEYKVAPNSELFIVLDPGTYTYSLNAPGFNDISDSVKIEANVVWLQPIRSK